jgi:cytochrome c oxidase subunit 2
MRRHWLRLAVPALLALSAVARAAEGTNPTSDKDGFGRPLDISLDGHRSDWLFDVTTVSVSILFLIMVGIILTVLLKHREKNAAHYEHGIGRSHLVMTAIISSIIFFGVDGTLLVNAFADIHAGFWNFPTAQQNPVVIEVVAQQWAWNVRYPGADGKFNTADDVLTLNDIRVPVGRPVMIKLQSKDVIHSFYLPNFRIKQDAVPGTTTRMWFQATKEGMAEIGCAQHCGTNHSKMKGELTVQSQADYDAWYKEAVADAQRRYDPNDAEAHWGWDWETN